MNILKYCAVSLLLAATSAQAPKAPVTISISGPAARVKAGERFPISILVTNIPENKVVLRRVNHGDEVGLID